MPKRIDPGDSQRLYGVDQIARDTGVSTWTVRARVDRKKCPPITHHTVQPDGRIRPMWDEASRTEWMKMYPHPDRPLPTAREPMLHGYSDRNAVNTVGGNEVSWRLWRCLEGGRPPLWLSTPAGWFVSDTGRRWVNTGDMLRPAGRFRVGVQCTPTMSRSIAQLRERLTSQAP